MDKEFLELIDMQIEIEKKMMSLRNEVYRMIEVSMALRKLYAVKHKPKQKR